MHKNTIKFFFIIQHLYIIQICICICTVKSCCIK